MTKDALISLNLHDAAPATDKRGQVADNRLICVVLQL